MGATRKPITSRRWTWRARRGNAEIIALALENLARDYIHQDNPRFAQHLLKEAVVITQAGNQIQLASRVIGLLAEATLAMGDRIAAQKLLMQAIHLAQQTGQLEQQLRWSQSLARLEMENQNYTAAIRITRPPKISRCGWATSRRSFLCTARSNWRPRTGGPVTAPRPRNTRRARSRRRAVRATPNTKPWRLTRLGMAAYGMNDMDRAQSFLSEALAHYDSGTLAQPDEHIQMLLTLGNMALRRGQSAEAQRWIDQALELARTHHQTEREAEALHLLGNLAARQGDRDAAMNYWQDALRLAEENNNNTLAIQLRCDIAQLRKINGDYKAALDEYERALVMLSHNDHPPTRGLVLSNAATLYTEMGDVETAQAFYHESIEIARATQDQHAESLRIGNLGWFYALTGRPQLAIGELEQRAPAQPPAGRYADGRRADE